MQARVSDRDVKSSSKQKSRHQISPCQRLLCDHSSMAVVIVLYLTIMVKYAVFRTSHVDKKF